MASFQNRTLTALVIFQNFLYPVMYRSVHVYRSEAGKEEMEEREYLLHEMSNFVETKCAPVITLYKFDVSAQFVGNLNGVWKCMFVYDSDRDQSTSVDASSEWLSIAENPKMEYIPTLANDLHAISELPLNVEFRESSGRSTSEESGGSNIKSHQLEKKNRVPFLDLNSLPCSDSETEENDQNVSDMKRKEDLYWEKENVLNNRKPLRTSINAGRLIAIESYTNMHFHTPFRFPTNCAETSNLYNVITGAHLVSSKLLAL